MIEKQTEYEWKMRVILTQLFIKLNPASLLRNLHVWLTTIFSLVQTDFIVITLYSIAAVKCDFLSCLDLLYWSIVLSLNPVLSTSEG